MTSHTGSETTTNEVNMVKVLRRNQGVRLVCVETGNVLATIVPGHMAAGSTHVVFKVDPKKIWVRVFNSTKSNQEEM